MLRSLFSALITFQFAMIPVANAEEAKKVNKLRAPAGIDELDYSYFVQKAEDTATKRNFKIVGSNNQTITLAQALQSNDGTTTVTRDDLAYNIRFAPRTEGNITRVTLSAIGKKDGKTIESQTIVFDNETKDINQSAAAARLQLDVFGKILEGKRSPQASSGLTVMLAFGLFVAFLAFMQGGAAAKNNAIVLLGYTLFVSVMIWAGSN